MFTVTKEFKKLLKKSESMTVFLDSKGCRLDFRPPRKWDKNSIYMDTVTSVQWAHEDRRFEKDKGAIFSISYGNYDVFPALYEILKPGDQISLRARENNNQYQTDAGLHNDELCLTVRRKDRVLIQSLVLASSTCPNNITRAIKAA